MSLLRNLTAKTHKQLGVFFIAFAAMVAFATLPSANEARSPILYVVIVGGVGVAIPAAIGISLFTGLMKRGK
jgi:hypothetical protein